MANFRVYKVKSLEGCGVVLLARVRDGDGVYISSTAVASVVAVVYDRSDGSLVGTTSFDPADAVFDTLQTDARWTEDDTGYNLALPLDGSYFPNGDTTYRVEATVTPTVDEYSETSDMPLTVAWDVHTVEAYGN